MVNRVYGYVRVSTPKQQPQRQIENIRRSFPDAIIIVEKYTGTTMNRPAWNKLMSSLRSGDKVVFDEISRMSRNAQEGIDIYLDLFNKGINLIFLKENVLNTEIFAQTKQLALTGNSIADIYIRATNEVLTILAKNQIRAAFEGAQREVDLLHKRTSEGVRRAQAEGKQVGRKPGSKITTAKSVAVKKQILRYSSSFNGTLSDKDTIKLIGNVSRNTYYKYKREILREIETYS